MNDYWNQGFVSTLAGDGTQGMKNGGASAASFNKPMGVVADISGSVFIADSGNHCVRRIRNGRVSTFSGSTWKGSKNGAGWQASFHSPHGLAVAEEDNLFVADKDNDLIRGINKEGAVHTRAGIPEHIFRIETFSKPTSVISVPDGLIFTTEDCILKKTYLPDDFRLDVVAGSQNTKSPKDGPAKEVSFEYPQGVAMGVDGLLVTDTHGLRKISEGVVSTITTKFKQPGGLIVDCQGNAIVADTGHNRVSFCTPKGDVYAIAGNGVCDFKDGPSRDASFNRPWGVAMDPRGRVLVTDASHRVRIIWLPSTRHLLWEEQNVSLPMGCAASRGANPFTWMAMLTVREGPFRGGVFQLSLELPFDYPGGCPVVKFVPPISHPNVDASGKVTEFSKLWHHTMNIGQALEAVRGLLAIPYEQKMVNTAAAELWEKNRLEFDVRARKEARESWSLLLKPGATATLVCDMLFPAEDKELSREAQHELFHKVAEQEIENHMKGSQAALIIHANHGDGQNAAQEVLIRARDQRAHEGRLQEDTNVKRAELKQKLRATLDDLRHLRNPRAAVSLCLEKQLARLCVAEKTFDGVVKVAEPPQSVPDLLKQAGLELPTTSDQCLEMLVKEAEREAQRLEVAMKTCTEKYELLYSRYHPVKQLNLPAGAKPEEAGKQKATNKQKQRAKDIEAAKVEKVRELAQQAKKFHDKLLACVEDLHPRANNKGNTKGPPQPVKGDDDSKSKAELDELQQEITQLEKLLEKCKQDFRSRFDSVKQPFSSSLRQPLGGSTASLLVAQAKLLEANFRPILQCLANTFNSAETKHDDDKKHDHLLGEVTKSSLRLSNGLRVLVQFGPPKSAVRVQQKGIPATVLDYARATVVFADPRLLCLFFTELTKVSDFVMLRVKNKFVERRATEPPDIHINLEFQGHICEILLMLEDFFLIKEYSHDPYDIIRIVRDEHNQPKPDDELQAAKEQLISDGVYYKHPNRTMYPPRMHSLLAL